MRGVSPYFFRSMLVGICRRRRSHRVTGNRRLARFAKARASATDAGCAAHGDGPGARRGWVRGPTPNHQSHLDIPRPPATSPRRAPPPSRVCGGACRQGRSVPRHGASIASSAEAIAALNRVRARRLVRQSSRVRPRRATGGFKRGVRPGHPGPLLVPRIIAARRLMPKGSTNGRPAGRASPMIGPSPPPGCGSRIATPSPRRSARSSSSITRGGEVSATMRGALCRGPQTVVVEELPRPTPGPEDVVVAVRSCGICGSDLPW
jgi:hypothetical protein